MKKKIFLICLISVSISLITKANQHDPGSSSAEELTINPEPVRYLVLDERIIEKTNGVKLTTGEIKKDTRNPLFREDRLWEPRLDNVYANVIYDEEEDIYKCWYSPFIINEKTSSTPLEARNPYSTN
jgi:hypothetical protein